MILLGLTGGIGMGKSTAAGLLARAGVAVVDTDELARRVVEPGQPALDEIRLRFGPDYLDDSGRLRRAELGRLVFQEEQARRDLEAILHPRIRALWMAQVENWREQGRPLAVVVIPLLFETGAAGIFEATVCVACSSGAQRRRLLARGWPEGQIQQRLAAQWPIDKKMQAADFVLWNEGAVEILAPQWEKVMERKGFSIRLSCKTDC